MLLKSQLNKMVTVKLDKIVDGNDSEVNFESPSPEQASKLLSSGTRPGIKI